MSSRDISNSLWSDATTFYHTWASAENTVSARWRHNYIHVLSHLKKHRRIFLLRELTMIINRQLYFNFNTWNVI